MITEIVEHSIHIARTRCAADLQCTNHRALDLDQPEAQGPARRRPRPRTSPSASFLWLLVRSPSCFRDFLHHLPAFFDGYIFPSKGPSSALKIFNQLFLLDCGRQHGSALFLALCLNEIVDSARNQFFLRNSNFQRGLFHAFIKLHGQVDPKRSQQILFGQRQTCFLLSKMNNLRYCRLAVFRKCRCNVLSGFR